MMKFDREQHERQQMIFHLEQAAGCLHALAARTHGWAGVNPDEPIREFWNLTQCQRNYYRKLAREAVERAALIDPLYSGAPARDAPGASPR